MLASVDEQASLSLTWSETPEDTFGRVVVQFCINNVKRSKFCSFYFYHIFNRGNHIWATSHENLSSGIFDQVWLNPVCSATATT